MQNLDENEGLSICKLLLRPLYIILRVCVLLQSSDPKFSACWEPGPEFGFHATSYREICTSYYKETMNETEFLNSTTSDDLRLTLETRAPLAIPIGKCTLTKRRHNAGQSFFDF